MQVEAIGRRVQYVFLDGTKVLLVPGTPVELPEAAARDLLQKVSAFVRVLPRTRQRYEVQTKTGPQQVIGSVHGGLLIHRSIAVSGWSVSHLRSGLKIVSRLPNRETAVHVRTKLLSTPNTDWFADDPFIHLQTKIEILDCVRSLPRWHSSKPLRTVESMPSSTSTIVAAWNVRDMGLDGEHYQALTLRPRQAVTPAQQRRLDHLSTLFRQLIPPIPVGALVTYERDGRLCGGPDQAHEGRVVRSRFSKREHQWWFYLQNGLIVAGNQIKAVTIMSTNCQPDREERSEGPIGLSS